MAIRVIIRHSTLHSFVDQLQISMGELHTVLSRTYFLSGMIEAEQAQSA